VWLKPALFGPDAPLQRPRGVREIQGQRAERGLHGDAADDRAGRQHGQRRTQRVAADVAEEDLGIARVPGQEGQSAGRHGRTGREQEPIRPPPAEARVGHAADQGVRPGNAVHAVHEVERVDESGDPHGREDGQPGPHGWRQREPAYQRGGDDGAAGPLECQPPADRQPAQVLSQPDQAECGHCDRERRRGRPADEHRGHQQSGGDRRSATPGCRGGMG
jgi:hypothetical protein